MQALPPITEDDIAQFLLHTPDFFERHAELLAAVQLTSPHAGRAVSLQERQAERLREKIRHLELKAAEMIRHGQDNLVLANRLDQWSAALLAQADDLALPATLTAQLQQLFAVPQVALRLWGLRADAAHLPQAQPVGDAAQAFAATLASPSCGPQDGLAAAQWLDEPAAAQSMAVLPLRTTPAAVPFGLLVLASDDPQRFHAGMGTDFLQRIAVLASAALSRLLPQP